MNSRFAALVSGPRRVPVPRLRAAPLRPLTPRRLAAAPPASRAHTALALLSACAASAALAQGSIAPTEPVTIDADRIEVRPDRDATAEGDVRVRRGPVAIRADAMRYDRPSDTVRASGGLQLTNEGDVFGGTELELQLQTYRGFVLQPEYFFARTQGGGSAERVDLDGRSRLVLTRGNYTSCDREGHGTPDWLLSAERLSIDVDANEGIAEGAVLEFLGVPILPVPWLSFPVTDQRKSGWLPPTFGLDSRSGVTLGVPYYWNLAPSYDATLTPIVYSRRGFAGAGEFRYLQPDFQGAVHVQGLANDRVFDDARWSFGWQHDGVAAGAWSYRADVQRVSDDDYWKDFDRPARRFTPRLLPQAFELSRPLAGLGGPGAQWAVYGGVQQWQVLQDTDPQARIAAPYERSPQLGLRGVGALGGVEYTLETEYNRFTRPAGGEVDAITGQRVHAVGSIAWPLRASEGYLIPQLAFNAAAYDTDRAMDDGRTRAQRVIPTLSADGGLVFERDVTWFDRALRQTLEPRLVYAYTPSRDQSALPLFDTALKDFNEVSIYSPNAFAGVDRVSDAHQLTAGLSSRVTEQASGIERMRVALVQRYLLRDLEVTLGGQPPSQRFSDVLLAASSMVTPKWTLDGSVQYSPSVDRTTRSILGARYSPGPFRTLGMSYSYARELSEQVDVAWQWPLFGPLPGEPPSAGGCRGSMYSVGRLSYNLRDSRLTDALLGVEYDSGCWIARAVVETQSTGVGEARTRVLLQLELVGLSRIGTNPLRVLKDNIPGYRLLRDDPTPPPPEPRRYE
jgi:LPS-assembly protein